MKGKGFTLIEISITMLIIALIITLVTAGTSIWKSARLRSVVADVQSYAQAVDTFKNKYHALPGDMTNASSFWPACDSPATLCDGDGNGQIGNINGGAESARLWQLLATDGARLIPGSYLGRLDAGAWTIGRVIPEASFGRTGFLIHYQSTFATRQENLIKFSSPDSGGNFDGPAISPQDAQSLDNKVDDGAPDNGDMYCDTAVGGAGCRAGTGPFTYSASVKTLECKCAFFYLK